jgi:hypothetical protein
MSVERRKTIFQTNDDIRSNSAFSEPGLLNIDNTKDRHCTRFWAGSIHLLSPQYIQYIVAYLLHARTVEPLKQPLLSNTRKQQEQNGVMQPVSKQQLSKHVPMLNTPQQQRCCFVFVVRDATVARQWCGRHASGIQRLFFLRGLCRGVFFKTIGTVQDEVKPDIKNIRGLNLEVGKLTNVQVTKLPL